MHPPVQLLHVSPCPEFPCLNQETAEEATVRLAETFPGGGEYFVFAASSRLSNYLPMLGPPMAVWGPLVLWRLATSVDVAVLLTSLRILREGYWVIRTRRGESLRPVSE